MRYLFEDYAFDTDRRELHRGAELISIAPQVFDLLDYLIRNRERVVSKDDLINAVWKGRIVSDAALTTRLNAARSAIDDTGEAQRLIKTLPRKGFRFVGAVQEAQRPAIAPVSSAAENVDTAQKSFSPPRLSIVVLPFTNLSGDPEQEYFVDGVTESLTTDLSRISGSFVIGRHTAFTYKGKSVDLKQIGRELNICYVLEGSVQWSGNRLRVNVQLLAAQTGSHLWGERFDKPVADLFDMQDEIVSRIANALDAQLTEEEAKHSERSAHPNSMDLYFRGKALMYKGWTPQNLAQARSIFERALVLDPENVEVMVRIANIDVIVSMASMTDNGTALLEAAETRALKALSLAPNHAMAHAILGAALTATNRAVQGIAEFERALALDRNLAPAHAAIGWAKFLSGRAAETAPHINEAFRLSPRDIYAHRWMLWMGLAKLHLGADVEAVGWFRRSIEANRNVPLAHFSLAAVLALQGLLDQARTAAKAGLELDPNFSLHRFRNNAAGDNPTYLAGRNRFSQGLRLAGIPEG